MTNLIEKKDLLELGLPDSQASELAQHINSTLNERSAEEAWQHLSQSILPSQPFILHAFIFKKIFSEWPHDLLAGPAWQPNPEAIPKTHLSEACIDLGFDTYSALHHWSFTHYRKFWTFIIDKLGIVFKKKFDGYVVLLYDTSPC